MNQVETPTPVEGRDDRTMLCSATIVDDLYRRYYPLVYSRIYQLVQHHETAEDLASEAWIKVIRALPRLRPESNVKGWLWRIATNTAGDFHRTSVSTHPHFSLDAFYTNTDDEEEATLLATLIDPDPLVDPESCLLTQERRTKMQDAIGKALATLSTKQQKTLMQWAQGDLPKYATSGIRTQVYRGRINFCQAWQHLQEREEVPA